MGFSAEHIIGEIDPLYQIVIGSPIGNIRITGSERGLRGANFVSKREAHSDFTLLRQAAEQVREYFEGKRREFFLPLDIHGTPFQEQVWKQLLEIPYGEVSSYQDLALGLGGSKVSRAVGTAVGSNPLAIILPCHRVIGSDGDLHGYAWGNERKRWLLDFESWQIGGRLFGP